MDENIVVQCLGKTYPDNMAHKGRSQEGEPVLNISGAVFSPFLAPYS